MKTGRTGRLQQMLLAALLVVLSAGAAARAMDNPYGEESILSIPRANAIHDRVRIVINLSATANHKASTETSKETSAKWSFAKLFKITKDGDGDIIAQAFPAARKPELDMSTSREHKGDGKTEVKYTTQVILSGEVIEVYPNGHLAVEAKRTVHIQNEEQTVSFTGTVDPQDLTADNSVDSNNVIGLTVRLVGAGDVSDAVKRGWLAKAFDFLSPF